MKISKSKQELARIISENGGWCDGELAAQDSDGGVGGYEVKPEWNSRSKSWWRAACGEWFMANKIKNHHQTVLSRAEYFHLYPEPDADGWIEWRGGECPVDGDVNVKFWNGTIKENPISARELYWEHDGDISDIIAYRPHKSEQSKPEFCESVMRTIPEPEAKPTIEQLATDYQNAKDYAYRKRKEAYAAKADADEKLRALELAGEAIGLLVTPITAKQETELVITDWRDLRVGDLVVITGSGSKAWSAFEGKELSVARTGCSEDELMFISEDGDGWYASGNTQWRFIRRP